MKFAALATAALLAYVAWGALPVSFAADGGSVTTINGEVEALAGQTYDNLSTVNGEVTVRRGATVGSAKTVNGEIEVEADAKVGNLSTVNGSVGIGEGVTVTGNASTVNGEVTVAKRAHVGGNVSTVSGEIELKGAEVVGTLTTVNGDIDLAEGARVRGDLVVKRPNSDNWNWKKDDERPVKVHVCATCVVDGELRFERAVELRVDAGGKTGKVIGDKVTRR